MFLFRFTSAFHAVSSVTILKRNLSQIFLNPFCSFKNVLKYIHTSFTDDSSSSTPVLTWFRPCRHFFITEAQVHPSRNKYLTQLRRLNKSLEELQTIPGGAFSTNLQQWKRLREKCEPNRGSTLKRIITYFSINLQKSVLELSSSIKELYYS